jgi:FKBP-type peptidyl-prolyl cis-trans isomerase
MTRSASNLCALAAALSIALPVVPVRPAGAATSVSYKPVAATTAAAKTVTLPDGLKYTDLNVGKGARPRAGATVVVHYTGTFLNGKKFDSSRGGKPLEFPLGQHRVIKCWDEAVATMRVGGHRKLVCPPQLAYGARGYPPVIPPNTTLNFDVELVGVK